MKQDNGDEYLLQLAGKTSVAFLDSTLERLGKKYCTKGFLGTKQSSYNMFAKNWKGFVWDILILRATTNYLMHEGFSYTTSLEIIREIIYTNIYPKHIDGRPSGIKGEKVGDGRKKNGTRKNFKLGNYNRQWVQCNLTNSVGYVLDMVGEYRKNKTGRSYTWSRQKNATFMSMVNIHENYHHPRMSEFFYADDIL